VGAVPTHFVLAELSKLARLVRTENEESGMGCPMGAVMPKPGVGNGARNMRPS
jgi:hypothetical protein